MKARLIAFYLPQFHSIPENDAWWGEGFTEWTLVKRAKPLFRGHDQPRVPAELGYYNLLDPEVRKRQACLAKEHGIEGFCYWHYWFGGGKRLLEKPFQEVLRSKEPDFPFCLAWANDAWTETWKGCPDRVLIQQTYRGAEDDKRHFYALLEAFQDKRYLTIHGKPLFLVYKPAQIPNSLEFTSLWRNLARKEGLKGIYFIAISDIRPAWDAKKLGYDERTITSLGRWVPLHEEMTNPSKVRSYFNKIKKRYRRFLGRPIHVYSYKSAVKHFIENLPEGVSYYPGVIPNWDDTPRYGLDGMALRDSCPELFKEFVKQAVGKVLHRPPEERMIFIKSWNEWGEGNYLEPDQRFGLGYLQVLKEAIS